MIKTLLLLLAGGLVLFAQKVDPIDGLWQGDDVSNQLVALAEAIPA
jgi:hypothetical protein